MTEEEKESSSASTDEKASEDKEELNIEEIKKSLEESEKKATEYLAGWQRARADLINYKKDEMERVQVFLKYANEELILKILPILDNFDLVESKMPEELKKDSYVEGLIKIKTQLEDFLKNQGVEKVESIGKKFDPNFHEAVEEVEIKDKESGIVIEETQKGYTIDGRLLRPARVRVTK